MVHCYVKNCKSIGKRGSNISFHRLPENKTERQIWLKRIGKPADFVPAKGACICSVHFPKTCFKRDLENQKNARLKAHSFPTLKLPFTPYVPPKDEQNMDLDTSLLTHDHIYNGTNHYSIYVDHNYTAKFQRNCWVESCVEQKKSLSDEVENLQQTIEDMQKERKSLTRRIARLEQKLEKSEQIGKEKFSIPEGNELLKDIVARLTQPPSYPFTPRIKSFSISLKSHSPKSYSLVRDHIKVLPNLRTIKFWSDSEAEDKPQINDESKSRESETSKLPEMTVCLSLKHEKDSEEDFSDLLETF